MPRRLPVPAWVAAYHRGLLRGDVVAGVTITAYLVPQVMAYAEVAGLPAVAGLWACTGALLAYALLGSSTQLSVGPESTTALMTAAALGSLATPRGTAYADLAAALCLAVAALCLLAWLGRLSFVADLLSRPALVGYLAGVAAVMIVSQLGRITGVEVQGEGTGPELASLARQLDHVQPATLTLGLSTLAAMLVGSRLLPRVPMSLVGMLGAAAVVWALDLRAHGITVVGSVPAGLPVPRLPSLSLDGTLTLLPVALGITFVGYTDNVLTARAFADERGERVDPRRELLALGAANLAAGLMHGFPVSSSGSRTAIGHAAGGRTQLTGVVTLLSLVVALLTLRPVLASFPTAALGAVVVYAALRLIEVSEFRRLTAFRRTEGLIALATALVVLAVGVLPGVLVAISLSVLDLLRRVARPHDAIEGFVPGLAGMHDVDDYPGATSPPGLVVYRYDSPLFFANTEDFRRRALAAVDGAATPTRWFVLNAEAVVDVDITALDALEALRAELVDRGIVFAMARVKHELHADLARVGLVARVGEDLLFPTLPTAVAAYDAWRAGRDRSP